MPTPYKDTHRPAAENTISHHCLTGSTGSGDHSEIVSDQERTKPQQKGNLGAKSICVHVSDCAAGFSRMCIGKLEPADQIQPTLNFCALFEPMSCFCKLLGMGNEGHRTEPYVAVEAKILVGV